MLCHSVLFKLTDPTDQTKAFVQEQILGLQEKIFTVKKCSVGLNISTDAKAYDLIASFDFLDRDDLQKFAIDPYHIEVINTIKPLISDIKVIDYWLL